MCRYLQKRDNLEFWGALNPYKIWFWCIIHIDPIVNDDMLISSAMAQLAFTAGELLMEHTGMLSLSTSLSFTLLVNLQAMWICTSGSLLLITPIHDVRNHRKRQKCFWRNLTMCIREHKEHPGAIVVKRHVYVSWFLFVTRCACLHCLGWERHPGAIVVRRQIRQLVACWHARYPSPGSPSFWQSLLRHPH